MSDNQSSSSNPSVKKPVSKITPKMIGLGCLGISLLGLTGIVGIVMLSIAASPYKISCQGDGSVAKSGFMDQKSADAAIKENMAKGMTCTKAYPQSGASQQSVTNPQSVANQSADSSDAPQLERSQVETSLKADLAEKTQLVVESIQCPDQMRAQVGQNYDCETRVVSADGGNRMKTILTIKPAGSDGTYDYETSKVFLLGATIEASVMDVIQAEVPKSAPVVKCPAEMVAAVGQSYECSVVVGAQKGRAIIQPTSDGGSYDREIKMDS